MRRVIAQRLLESKTTIPHFYLNIEIDTEPLMNLREQVNVGERPRTADPSTR
jgi:pyruvate dehydrogenase E2 component (dihydrolipoamide acetyltransferase)